MHCIVASRFLRSLRSGTSNVFELSLAVAAALSSCAPLVSSASAGTPPPYNITEILPPAGATGMTAMAINSRGDVAGYYTSAANETRGFVWSNNALTTLPPLPGHAQCLAQGITDEGAAVGYSGPSFAPDKAVIWTNAQPVSLDTLGGPWSAAEGVSSTGLVAGWATVEQTSTRFHGFVYDGSTMHDVGLLLGGVATELSDVNAQGVAVGDGQTNEGHFRAIMVDPNEGIIELGTLGGVTSAAEAISDAGHIVGRAQVGVPSAATFEGIVRHAFMWHEGKMIDLGSLPGLEESRAMDVNSSAQAVGTANNANFSILKPFLWQDGTMTDLNALLPAGSGWVLRTAMAINESGWIVGNGTLNGQPRAYLLRPAVSQER